MADSIIRRAIADLMLCLSLVSGPALAADTKISAMTSATTLTGTEVVPGVQSSANVKITATQIKTFAQSGLAAVATSGSATDLTTGTIPAARLPLFGSAANGAVAASGGGTTNYLRADGTWATPPGTGGGTGFTVSSQSGTSYTFVLGDANSYVRSTNAAATVFTIPTNASVAFPIGASVCLVQAGAGSLSIAAAGGVTVNSRGSAITLAGQYGVACATKMLTDTWVFTGDII